MVAVIHRLVILLVAILFYCSFSLFIFHNLIHTIYLFLTAIVMSSLSLSSLFHLSLLTAIVPYSLFLFLGLVKHLPSLCPIAILLFPLSPCLCCYS